MPKIPKITRRTYPVVLVEWEDAGGDDGWEAIGPPERYPVTSAGILTATTKTAIGLVQDITPDGQCNGRETIPLSTIHRIKVLGRVPRPLEKKKGGRQ
jgi:hypothetical protein